MVCKSLRRCKILCDCWTVWHSQTVRQTNRCLCSPSKRMKHCILIKLQQSGRHRHLILPQAQMPLFTRSLTHRPSHTHTHWWNDTHGYPSQCPSLKLLFGFYPKIKIFRGLQMTSSVMISGYKACMQITLASFSPFYWWVHSGQESCDETEFTIQIVV